MCMEMNMDMEGPAQTVCVCRSWLLYVEPGFRGSCVVLEEGEKVLTCGEGELKEHSTDSTDQVSIGSIRTVVKVFPPLSISVSIFNESLSLSLHVFLWVLFKADLFSYSLFLL